MFDITTRPNTVFSHTTINDHTRHYQKQNVFVNTSGAIEALQTIYFCGSHHSLNSIMHFIISCTSLSYTKGDRPLGVSRVHSNSKHDFYSPVWLRTAMHPFRSVTFTWNSYWGSLDKVSHPALHPTTSSRFASSTISLGASYLPVLDLLAEPVVSSI